MAVRSASVVWVGKRKAKVTWSGLLNGDTGNGQDLSRFRDVVYQVTGTLGAGGSVSIEGSNDAGTTYHILNDSRGETNAMTFTALDTRRVNERPLLSRPNVTAGDGTTNFTVTAVATAD
jgi:hypothetical protein